jgi:hypothetical protein
MGTEQLLETLKRQKEQEKSQGGGKGDNKNHKAGKVARLVTRDPGNYLMTFLPNKSDADGVPYERVFLHFGFEHPNYKTPGTFRCLGRDCPLCTEYKKMVFDKKKDAWRYKSTPVYLYYVVDSSKNFKFIRLSRSAHDEVINEIESKARAMTNVLSLDNGRVAKLSLEKMDDNKNKWRCNFLNDSNSVEPDLRNQLKSAPELDSLYRVYSTEELDRVVKGIALDFSKFNNRGRSEAAAGSSPASEQKAGPLVKPLAQPKEEPKRVEPVERKPVQESQAKRVDEDVEARKKRIREELATVKKQ